MIRVVLVDDEPPAIKAMQYLLEKYEDIDIVGSYTDAGSMFDELDALKPDVLFLDIEIRDINGLDIGEKLYDIMPDSHIVFVTAYNEYAVSAFELNAVDYLLKPVSETRLAKTIQRISLSIQQRMARESSELKSSPEIDRSPVQVRCFGRFQVSGGATGAIEVVKWRTAKAEELFALFIHHYGNALHKDFIIEQLWPDIPYESALMKLHTAVSHIRKAIKSLEPGAELRFSQDCYRLLLQGLWRDVDEFKQLAKEAVGITDERLLKIINELIDLYRGDYVEENDYRWSIDEGRRLADQFSELLMRAVESCIQRNQDKEAIAYLRLLIRRNPFEEAYYRHLFTIYAKLRDHVSIDHLYKELSVLLQQELGTRPQPITTALYESLLTEL